MISPFAGLLEAAEEQLSRLVEGLAAVEVHPGLDVRLTRAEGLLAWCDLDGGQIHMPFPEPDAAHHDLQLLYLGELYGTSSDAALSRLITGLMPWTVAHELGHHLRVRYGLWSDDRWWEEQVANALARAAAWELLDAEDRRTLAGWVGDAAARAGSARVDWAEIRSTYDTVLAPTQLRPNHDSDAAWLAAAGPEIEAARARVRAGIREGTLDDDAYQALQLGWIYLALRDPRPTSFASWRDSYLNASLA